MAETDNILALLESLTPPQADDVARNLADDFRARRVEKGLTRSDIAARSGVALANIARFEQKGLISLKNFIELAIATNYLAELKQVFATPKFSTVAELAQIHRNAGKKKARHQQ